MTDHSIKYTYVRHPLCQDWVLTIARKWDNPEKTRLKVSWCANKTQAFVALDRFDKKRARLICKGRFNSAGTHVIMELEEPYKYDENDPLITKILQFVHTHPALPNQLKKLMTAAAAADYKVLPVVEMTTLDIIKYRMSKI